MRGMGEKFRGTGKKIARPERNYLAARSAAIAAITAGRAATRS